MKKQVITGEEAKLQILEGAKVLYDAVSVTLGPKGQNAVIEAYGEPIVTHDGVTVAKAVDIQRDDRPGMRVGVEMIKSSSSKTNDNVGDGTTSSTILAYHLIDAGMKLVAQGTNPMVLRRELEEASRSTLTKLAKLAEPVTTEKSAIEVATISSEDPVIGKEVGRMFHKLGKEAMVAVEIGTKTETEYEIVEGYTFDRGFASPLMVNDTRTQTATVHKPRVLITEKTLSTKDVYHLCEQLYQEDQAGIVLIAGEFKNDLLDFSILKKTQGFEIIAIKAPGFGEQRPKLLLDIAKLLNGKVVKDFHNLQPSDLGTCEKMVITALETVITGGSDVSEHIKDLEAEAERTKGEFDKQKIEKRIGQLHAKIGQIRVGGNTEMEAEERKYLIDDAVAATEAALKEGIVPGGATTYVWLSKSFQGPKNTPGEAILAEALQAPFKVLMANAGERYGKKLEELVEFGKGYDIMNTGGLIDLKEHGIIDPVLVIKQAITNAVSVAGSALTTGVLIVNEKEKEDEEE